ncbi:DNA cytosine methyltransferase [Gulosibacter sediminis]|uniref:DNA cytosine methyltransferase n=1 Tax=Gulosibacter sediminis TaxID=1729695 RepID=UPI0024A8CF14|nr:DNA cytosine methyltransferase [Gulosibacter sediminis]
MSATFLDFFAGFGGSSSGLVEAGFELATAYNHWDKAIAVHAANHRKADHVQGDLSGYDMRRLPKGVYMLWASPECTWHSPAGGRKRIAAQAEPDLFGEPELPRDAGERSRATMWDPIRAAEAREFPTVVIENVPEVASWPLFNVWLQAWEALGYSWQVVNANTAHVYSADNAPAGQWRDRIYIVLSRGREIAPISPRPIAYCPQCERVGEARQHWKRQPAPGAPAFGKYGRQYFYVCDSGEHAMQPVEPMVAPAASVIDWSDLGIRIGDREALGMRPLAAATMRRIEVGLRMFARPAVVAHSGQTWDAAKPGHRAYLDPAGYYRAWDAAASPLMARQAGGSGDALAVPPHMISVNHGGAEGRAQLLDGGPLPARSTKIGDGLVFPPHVVMNRASNRGTSVDDALATLTTGNNHGVAVPPYVVEMYGTSTARATGSDALSAVTAGGNHHGVAVPPGSFLSRQYTQRGSDSNVNTSVFEPTHAITATGGNHALVTPTRERPKDQFAGDLPFELEDVSFRMLGPTEHLRAQRFWEGYDTSAANKSETTKGAGNAVSVNVAHWIGSSVLERAA